ncbi:MAG: signal peptidase II [Anaerolineae bacterium]|nr:signal peptidase II [Anaerolineae bacterium]
MNSLARKGLLLWGVAAVVVLADQLSKLWVVNNLPEYVSVDIIPWLSPIFSFTRLSNTGVAFGLFPQFGGFFTVLSLVVVVAIVLFYRSLSSGDWLTHLALGLQIGGALGNLVDRLARGFVVIDFIDLNFWPLRDWPVFNLADSSIVVGVGLLLLATWLEERRAGMDPLEIEEHERTPTTAG